MCVCVCVCVCVCACVSVCVSVCVCVSVLIVGKKSKLNKCAFIFKIHRVALRSYPGIEHGVYLENPGGLPENGDGNGTHRHRTRPRHCLFRGRRLPNPKRVREIQQQVGVGETHD